MRSLMIVLVALTLAVVAVVLFQASLVRQTATPAVVVDIEDDWWGPWRWWGWRGSGSDGAWWPHGGWWPRPHPGPRPRPGPAPHPRPGPAHPPRLGPGGTRPLFGPGGVQQQQIEHKNLTPGRVRM